MIISYDEPTADEYSKDIVLIVMGNNRRIGGIHCSKQMGYYYIHDRDGISTISYPRIREIKRHLMRTKPWL